MNDQPHDGSGRVVESVDTACTILDSLHNRNGAGVTELANQLSLSKACVHTHLATLRQNEFVHKRGDTYHISLKFLDIGYQAKLRHVINDVVEFEVGRLVEETDEIGQFMIEEHGKGVYLSKKEYEGSIQTGSTIGSRTYLHHTALGKAILAYSPREKVDRILDRQGLPAMTPKTITDREAFLEELESVREEGVAFSDEEIQPKLRCIAAPVRTADGTVLGSVGVAGPANRLKGSYYTEKLPNEVKTNANVIEINVAERL